LIIRLQTQCIGISIFPQFNKIKTTWNIINTETGLKNNSNKDSLPKIFLKNAKIINTDEAALNAYSAISYLHTHFPKGFPDMNINPVSEEEMISKNSSGYNGIINKLIKLSSQLISKPLTYIVNKSLIMGLYPERLKYAVVKPVYKKGEKAGMSNYRPISILTGFAKIFEMVIFKTKLSCCNS
jgi:hypothetical protein